MAEFQPLLRRLLGLETEYAVRYSEPDRSPGNDLVFQLITEAIKKRVQVQPGGGLRPKKEIFTENGGAFSYEHLPHCPWGGLVEGATPECLSPGQLLLYQKAQETLLLDCLDDVRAELAHRGYSGELGLIKNCRDSEGHIYGAQENYETDIARGPWLWAYRAGLALLLPWTLLFILLALVLQIIVVIVITVICLLGVAGGLAVPRLRKVGWIRQLVRDEGRDLDLILGWIQLGLSYSLTWPVLQPFSLLLHLTAYRRERHHLLAFLASRALISGTGTVESDGRFSLSEKGPAVRRILRWTAAPGDRPIFDTGHLMKRLIGGMDFRVPRFGALFHRRQRLQLGLADSNVAQVAEYLKIGTTALMLDLLDAGWLDDAPRLAKPVEALKALVADPTLEAKVALRDGTTASALDLQRYYFGRAEAYLKATDTPSLEAAQLVSLWGQALDALESGRQRQLAGRIDWITKRLLLEGGAPSGGGDLLKTLDLRYHELGDGYLARLEAAGLAPRLVSEEEIHQAIEEPPQSGPASLRGRLIRDQAHEPTSVRVSWDSAYIGGWLKGKIIRFPKRDL